jgi:hypothetical protein
MVKLMLGALVVSGLALGAVTSTAIGQEPIQLTEFQMDAVTAGQVIPTSTSISISRLPGGAGGAGGGGGSGGAAEAGGGSGGTGGDTGGGGGAGGAGGIAIGGLGGPGGPGGPGGVSIAASVVLPSCVGLCGGGS